MRYLLNTTKYVYRKRALHKYTELYADSYGGYFVYQFQQRAPTREEEQ